MDRLRRRITGLCAPLILVALTGACGDTYVEPPWPVASVRVWGERAELEVGGTLQLVAELRDQRGRLALGRPVEWTSSDTRIATVSATGLVRALDVGAVTITAASESRTGQALVQVTEESRAVASVVLEPSSWLLPEGSSRTFVATARDAAGRILTGRVVRWSSSHPSIAEIRPNGTVVGIRPGQVTITAQVDNISATASATVELSNSYDLAYDAWRGVAGQGPELQRLDIRAAQPEPVTISVPGFVRASHPAPRYDGMYIAFAGFPDLSTHGIWIVRRDGSDLRRLTDQTFDDQPAWSPDGAYIAFRRWPLNGNPDIWIVPADGSSAPINLTGSHGAFGEHAPAWAPRQAGSVDRIAYSRVRDGRAHIFTMLPDGTDVQQVTSGEVFDDTPSWDPYGDQIVFQRHSSQSTGKLWLASATGGDERVLVPDAVLPGPQFTPSWSPDGRFIAFVSRFGLSNSSGTPQVFTVRPDGTRLAQRTFDATVKDHPSWLYRP